MIPRRLDDVIELAWPMCGQLDSLYDRFWRKAAIELYSKRISLALVRWSYPKLAHEGPDRKGNPLGK